MNWLILILGILIGLYIKTFVDDFIFKVGLKVFFGDKDINDQVNKIMQDKNSRFNQRLEEIKAKQK